jgi:hypothetical protein
LATLRTAIPRSIIRQWEVKDGNKLDWKRNVIDAKDGLNNYKNCIIEL